MNKFPKNFLWGASTSAFQVEGAYLDDGKKLSIADVRASKKSDIQLDTKVVIDHYHRYKEDIALMKELGLKSYRFSINWTRIYPNGDEEVPNEKGLEFYNNLVDELIYAGIEPMITLYHFDQPMGLIEKYGGWVSDESIHDFVKYGKTIIDTFSDRVKYWFTINEQAVMVLASDMLGIEADSQIERLTLSYKANFNMWLAQAKVIAYAKEKRSDILIGPAISYITTLPNSKKSIDMNAAKELEDFFSFAMMDVAVYGEIPKYFTNELLKVGIDIPVSADQQEVLVNGVANMVGVNWYCTTIVKAKENFDSQEFIFNRIERVIDNDLKYTDWGWNFDPRGLRYGMRQLMYRYPKIPVVITECGWSQRENLEEGHVHDIDRINYLNDHIEQLQLSIQDGVNVIGFSPWSFIDILSVGDGMNKRYGMVYVDRTDFEEKTLKRYKKDSFYFYQKVIRLNSLDALDDK